MKVKVCGMRHPENLEGLSSLRPDYIGFIFYEKSKRYAGDIDAELLMQIPPGIKKTGVFVNAELSEIIAKVEKYHLDAVQLHGNEDAGFCRSLKDHDVEVIKAFGIDGGFDFTELSSFAGSINYFLFDTKTAGHGGSGQLFDWDLLKKYNFAVPYFLSGGLDLSNLEKIKDLDDPRLYAVDINSRFETEPGLKDLTKVQEALEMIRRG